MTQLRMLAQHFKKVEADQYLAILVYMAFDPFYGVAQCLV